MGDSGVPVQQVARIHPQSSDLDRLAKIHHVRVSVRHRNAPRKEMKTDQPFDALRCARWRWFWDFGGGHLTDLYSHYGDVVQWYMEQYAPRTAQATGNRQALPQFECPDTINAAWDGPGFTMV